MEGNKVVLSLDEYLKLYDNKKETDQTIKEIIEHLFNCLEEDNGEISFDKYNISTSKMKRLLEKYDKERFELITKELKEE